MRMLDNFKTQASRGMCFISSSYTVYIVYTCIIITLIIHVSQLYSTCLITYGRSSKSGGGSGTSVGELGAEDPDILDVTDILCFRDKCGGDVLERRPSPTGTLYRKKDTS